MDQNISLPIYQQIYHHLRSAILSGQLKRGKKITSTRTLAVELGVSRNTILNAYDQLAAEGYLERVEGKGTFVTESLPEDTITPAPHTPPACVDRPHRLSETAEAALSLQPMPGPFYPPAPGRTAFPPGIPALDAFPYDLWARLVSRRAHGLHPDALNYADPMGHRPLREAIADYLIEARQVSCIPDQIIIVNSSKSAVHLATQVLLNPGDPVWMEDPGYRNARNTLAVAGARIVPVPVDQEGIQVETGMARARNARAAYVTPANQFPLGMTLSLQRRLALLDWARQSGAYIIEDEYDSEYRFDGPPLATLRALDHHDSVIYTGTFSKVVFPGLRIAYLVVPKVLVDAFVTTRRATETHPPHLEQAVLADFIAEGHFARHIRRMRTLYAERRAAMLEAAGKLPLELDTPHTGMHLIGWLPPGESDCAIAARAADLGVDVVPVSTFAVEPMPRGGLILGYGPLNPQEIRKGVRRLAAAFKK